MTAVDEQQAQALREPWSDLDRQRDAATFGMWLFLMSEMLFFGAALIAFGYTRLIDVAAFGRAANETSLVYGAANTATLVTSSLTVTLAIQATQAGDRRAAARLLAVTAALGVAFLAIKGFEYRDDLERGLFPDQRFALGDNAAEIFFAFYWILTGVHAIHLTIGVGLVGRLAWLAHTARQSLASPQFEVAALYWHLVDAFWLVLFPLLYVAGRQ